MIYIAGGYKTPTLELEKNPCSFSKQNKGRVTTSIVQEMHIAMYDIYRWWVRNPFPLRFAIYFTRKFFQCSKSLNI